MEVRIVPIKDKPISDFLQVSLLLHLLQANSNRFLVEFLNNKLNNLLTDNRLQTTLHHHNNNNNKDKIETLVINNNNNKYLPILVLEIISNNKTLSHHLEVLDRIGRNPKKTAIVPPRKRNSLRKTQVNIGSRRETKYSRKGSLIQRLSTTQER